jgi:hypothetical protein
VTDESWERLPLFDGPLPGAFERRIVVIGPGDTRVTHQAEWRDAIVVVAQGRVDVVGVGGTRHSFGHGDVITLDRVPVRRLCNHGSEPAVLMVLRRRAGWRRRGVP